jgi:CheY-like chemotaxis protein
MEAVGTLAGGIAHDFNNILNVILGYGTMVMDKLEAGSSSKEHMIEVLIAADRAANLTKRLLVFSRKQVVEVRPININELILGLQKMLVRVIRESIDFNLDLAGRPLIVLADAGQIEQVLMNLVSNAKDAMQEGGRLTIGTKLKELDDEYVAANGYGKPGKYVLISVADTGHGIDAETQKKIFEPFFTTKGIGEGTGLGLAISYNIVKQHSGYIKVYSEPGQGTVFRIYLPLSEEAAFPDKKTEPAVSVKGGKETVLVAEDDASLRNLARIVLESFGYSVISAENGEDAIIKFVENRDRIGLVLLDMIMPKKSGKEVSEAIRKVSPGIKIIYVSGYTMDMVKTDEWREVGFDFIQKPFPPQDLLKKVREVLDR